MHRKGFTLIELLVVISIISLLSAVVLSALSTGRGKARDAAIKAALKSVQSQAALVYDTNNGNYGTAFAVATCPLPAASGSSVFHNSIIKAAIANALSNSGSGGATRCRTDGSNYAVSVKLNTSANHWCVDSAGASKSTATTNWTGVACP